MEGKNTMGMSGPGAPPYYLQRSLAASPSASQPGLHEPQGMRILPNPSTSLPVQPATVGGPVNTGFLVEPSLVLPLLGVNVGGQGGSVASGELPVKRKRGRPRKYGSDGTMSLALSSVSSPRSAPCSATGSSGMGSIGGSGFGPTSHKRGRGRPPGTGRKQQLASCGEWVSSSAGMGFTPHIITISAGEDIAAKIMSFSQQGPRAVCILSANGAVSTVTLGQPASFGGNVTYEGRFEILGLSGSYLLSGNGESPSRNGGLSISLSSPDGRVIGGGVSGLLIAATPVQVIVGSFIYGASKAKNKPRATTAPDSGGGEDDDLPASTDMQGTPISGTPAGQILNPVLTGWPPGLRQVDARKSHIDIDLTRG